MGYVRRCPHCGQPLNNVNEIEYFNDMGFEVYQEPYWLEEEFDDEEEDDY